MKRKSSKEYRRIKRTWRKISRPILSAINREALISNKPKDYVWIEEMYEEKEKTDS